MSEPIATPSPTPVAQAAELAALLREYVPADRFKAVEGAVTSLTAERDQARKDVEKLTKDHGTLSKRAQELESKVRNRAYKDAYGAIAEELKVRPEFRDDVYDLLKINPDADEPDSKALKTRLTEFLDSRKQYLSPAEPEGDEGPTEDKPAKVVLTKGEGFSRGKADESGGKLKVRRSDLRNPSWMRENQSKYYAAFKAGRLLLVD